jgi:hypothetical protein
VHLPVHPDPTLSLNPTLTLILTGGGAFLCMTQSSDDCLSREAFFYVCLLLLFCPPSCLLFHFSFCRLVMSPRKFWVWVWGDFEVTTVMCPFLCHLFDGWDTFKKK